MSTLVLYAIITLILIYNDIYDCNTESQFELFCLP